MRQLQTRVLLLTSLLAVGGLVLALPFSVLPRVRLAVVERKTDLELRHEDMARGWSIPLSELPAHIRAPEGRISIHLNPQGDQLQAIVVNRTGKVMETSEHLHQLLLRLEAELAPGD